MPELEKTAVVTCWYRTWLGCMRIYFFKGVVGGGGGYMRGRESRDEKVRWFAISISLELIRLSISVCWGLLGWFSVVV